MRKTGSELWQQTNFTQDALHLVFSILFIFIEMMVNESLRNDIVNLCAFIQRSHRVLENHLTSTDDFSVHLGRNFAIDLLAFEQDLTRGCWIDSQNGATNGGFTGTRFTNQRECFTLINIKIYMVYCDKFMPAFAKGNLQIFYFD